jgi:hypothetical protein
VTRRELVVRLLRQRIRAFDATSFGLAPVAVGTADLVSP